MIDTIKGYMNLENTKYSDIEHLTKDCSVRPNGDFKILTTKLSNFTIRISFDPYYNPIKISFMGSLPRFYFGNNLAQLDLHTTELAVNMLCDNLNIDIKKAKITKIDIGVNLAVNKPVSDYIASIVGYPRLESCRYTDSILFFSNKGSKSLIFYDKLTEIKNRNKVLFNSLPEMFKCLNILRFETRTKNLKYHLHRDKVEVQDLYQKNFQNLLLEVLQKDFNKVKTMEIKSDPRYLISEYNGLLKYLSFHGIQRLSYENVVNIISSQNFGVKNPSVKRSKLKATLKEITRIDKRKENTSIGTIEELNSKFALSLDILK